MIKDVLTNFISFKYDLLLSELNHWTNNFRKVLNKASIEIAEVNEKLHLNEIIECKIINNCFKLIIKSSFKLTFWTQIEIESSCSHFQLDSSRVAHIFNLTWLDPTENWVNSTRFVKNLSLTSRKLNIEIFPTFALPFCIIFLHYLFGRKSWRENMKIVW